MKSLYKKIATLREYVGKISKTKENAFLKSNYADLNAVLEVCDPALHEAGLIFIDRIEGHESVHELIDPESGEMISSRLTLHMMKQDSQQYGAAQTYNRRYARMAMLNLQAEDSDGNIESGNTYIKPKAIKEINELMLKTKSDAVRFLAAFNVQSVKDLTEVASIQAIKTLKLKLSKETKDEK